MVRFLAPPFRTVITNLLLAIGVVLPVAIVSGAVSAWLFPPAWAGNGQGIGVSLRGFLGGGLFWYLTLALPTLVVAFLHQVLLAALPPGWSRRQTRIAILVSAFAVAGAIALWIVAHASRVNVPVLIGALVVPALCYGLLVRPLSSVADDNAQQAGGDHRAAG